MIRNDDIKRTSIDLPRDLYIQLKEHAAKSEKTLRDIAIEALYEKMMSERYMNDRERLERINNHLSREIIDSISKYTTEGIATWVVIERCSLNKLSVQRLRKKDLTEPLIEDILAPLENVLSPQILSDIRDEISSLG